MPCQNTYNKKTILQHQIFSNLIGLILCWSCFASSLSLATDTWVPNGDSIVTDVATGLMWQQQDDGIARSHGDAISYCQGLNLADETGWRLPNIKELISIVDYRSESPATDEAAFLGVTSVDYWSETTHASNPGNAWVVNFLIGITFEESKTDKKNVRCVR